MTVVYFSRTWSALNIKQHLIRVGSGHEMIGILEGRFHPSKCPMPTLLCYEDGTVWISGVVIPDLINDNCVHLKSATLEDTVRGIKKRGIRVAGIVKYDPFNSPRYSEEMEMDLKLLSDLAGENFLRYYFFSGRGLGITPGSNFMIFPY